MRLLAISGSLRAGSYNTALARAAADVAPDGVEVEIFDGLGELPLFDADLEGDAHPAVRHLRESIADADAVLFVTPEYNGSIPGVLKNAVDWASRPRDDAALRNKTVAVAGASTGQYGALWAQQDLRRVLGVAGARVVCPELPVGRAQDVCDRTADRARSSSSGSGPTSRSCSGSRADACRCLISLAQPIATLRSSRLGDPAIRNSARADSGSAQKKGRVSAALLERIPALDLVEALPARCEHPAARIASPLRWLGVSRWSRGHTSTRWYLHCPYCHHSSRTTSFPR